ncbi:MAG: hypothetical protein WA397_19740 [Roseiarcus sp.]
MLTIARPPQLRDVARNFRGADHLPARVLDRRDGQRNVDWAAILALPDGLEVLDMFAARNFPQDDRLFVQSVDRDDNRYRFADRLFGREAEKPLRGGVPAENDAIEILRQDGVFGGLDDGSVMMGSQIVVAPRRPTRRRSFRNQLIRALLIGRLTGTFQPIVLRGNRTGLAYYTLSSNQAKNIPARGTLRRTAG